jgi:hypothetical protein
MSRLLFPAFVHAIAAVAEQAVIPLAFFISRSSSVRTSAHAALRTRWTPINFADRALGGLRFSFAFADFSPGHVGVFTFVHFFFTFSTFSFRFSIHFLTCF